jgi:Flp pilus assembly protein TadD
MELLEPPDLHWLNAAQGWLMLGNAREGWAELGHIRADRADHPQVLSVKWGLLAAEKRWLEATAVAEFHLRVDPDDAEGWVHRSYSLHELRHTREALDRLLPAVDRFPEEGIIPYNLACYSCQLGDLPAAQAWLERAFTTDPDEETRWDRLTTALADADLQPLWPELKKKVAAQRERLK